MIVKVRMATGSVPFCTVALHYFCVIQHNHTIQVRLFLYHLLLWIEDFLHFGSHSYWFIEILVVIHHTSLVKVRIHWWRKTNDYHVSSQHGAYTLHYFIVIFRFLLQTSIMYVQMFVEGAQQVILLIYALSTMSFI